MRQYIFTSAHRRFSANRIRAEEKAAVIDYARREGNYNHRELTYRLIDENIAFMSISSVYRILKGSGLICSQKHKKQARLQEYYNPHIHPASADDLWQSDITFINFLGTMYFLLIFIDVFSRYITYYKLLTDMSSYTVSEEFREAIKSLESSKIPKLQTDNGSCYVGEEFKKLIKELGIVHNRIAPHCPNQNAEIERCNRTIKDLLLEYPDPKTFRELEMNIDAVINYYNNERYHSSLNYLPPKIYYRGDPERVLRERRMKIEQARKKRISANILDYKKEKDSFIKIEFCPTFN